MAFTAAYILLAALLLTNFGRSLFVPQKLGLVFNDMAYRLPRWDFSVTRDIIQVEAFIHNGVPTAYYGIFPALLRMPLVALGWRVVEFGTLFCLIALSVTVYAYIRLFQIAVHDLPGTRRHLYMRIAVGSVVLTGPQIFLLASASLYHELIFWSAGLVALFNLLVLTRFWQHQPFSRTDLLTLAVIAGLCLLCRLPDGLSLYVALLLLMIWTFVTRLAQVASGRRVATLLQMPDWLTSLLAAGTVALLFVAVQAVVDWERFGDPFATSPYHEYVQFRGRPADLVRFARHGLFSVQRMFLAIAYYGAGLKLEQHFPAAFDDLYGSIEGPRAIVPACAPLLFLLAAVGAGRLCLQRQAMPIILVVGNLAGTVIMLGFHALCLRYVFDGWGLLMILGAIGLRWIVSWSTGRWLPIVAGGLLCLGVLGSGLTLVRYKIVYSGTDPQVRYDLSAALQPLVCPHAPLDKTVTLTDFNPLVTPRCPPLW
jgi:hypothetical protein